jgi:hypothetical protein
MKMSSEVEFGLVWSNSIKFESVQNFTQICHDLVFQLSNLIKVHK